MSGTTTNGAARRPERPAGDQPRTDDAPSPRMPLGVGGFTYADLYDPARLSDLLEAFDLWFLATAPDARAQFELYRSSKGEGMSPVQQSEALLAAAPFVGRFVGKLF